MCPSDRLCRVVTVPLPPSADAGPLRLVVLGDSTAFTDHRGPQLPAEPGLYPTVAATRLEASLGRAVEVTTVARPGMTVREAWRTVVKDRHVQFEILAGAHAVVVGIGGFDHAPAGIPPSVEALVPFLRPAGVRRRVRRALRTAYPWVVRTHAGHRTRTPPAEFARLFDAILLQVRGLVQGAAGVVLGPTSHRSPYYAYRDPAHAAGEDRQLAIARGHGFATVPVWPFVVPSIAELNPDGIHWPASVHERVGTAVADALVPQLTGERPALPVPTWD